MAGGTNHVGAKLSEPTRVWKGVAPGRETDTGSISIVPNLRELFHFPFYTLVVDVDVPCVENR
jgi:hypothetical protein